MALLPSIQQKVADMNPVEVQRVADQILNKALNQQQQPPEESP
jgi:hypothetical protein